MDKMEAVKIFDKLNKVISGSQSIIKAIDEDKEINVKKAIRASMLNSQIIAIELKSIIIREVDGNKKPNPKDYDLPEGFDQIFSGFKK